MRKRLISFALAATIMVSTSLPAFATKKFDMSVFSGRDDIYVSYDDITAVTTVNPRLDGLETYVSVDSGMIFMDPEIGITESPTDSLDIFIFGFKYFGNSWADLNEMWVKIGDNRYNFSNCYTSQSVAYDNLAFESICFELKHETIPFMQDLIKHQDEEIKVRLDGDTQSFDFVLTEDMKKCAILMYSLFIDGGGTRKSNMDTMSSLEQTVVRKNYHN